MKPKNAFFFHFLLSRWKNETALNVKSLSLRHIVYKALSQKSFFLIKLLDCLISRANHR